MLTDNQLVQAFELERNGTKFPIKFDDAWQKMGYSRKNNAKRAIVNKLIENEDYCVNYFEKSNRLKSMVPGSPEYAAMSRMEFIYLSVDGYDHFCMLSDTPEGREERKRFIQIKKAYIASLERALFSEPNPEVESLRQENTQLKEENIQLRSKLGATLSDRKEFPYSSKQLQRDSRIASHSYVVGAIKRDFAENQDYQVVEGEVFITEPLYQCFMLSFRSKLGVDVSVLPATLVILTNFFFQFQTQRSRKNSRIGQTDTEHQQLEIQLNIE